MARLATAQCPTCKAGIRVDPDVEYHVCSQCKARAFVRSPARVVPPAVQQQGIPVIVLSGGYTWTLPLVLALVALGCGFVAVSLLRSGAPERWVAETSNAVRSNLDAVGTLVANQPQSPPEVVAAAATAAPASAPLDGNGVSEPNAARRNVAQAPSNAATAEPTSAGAAHAGTANNGASPSTTSAKPRAAKDNTTPGPGKTAAAKVTTGQITVSGRLAPAQVRKVVGGVNGRFRMCYERGLQSNATLSGSVSVRFVIGRDGAVSNASNGGANLADSSVTSCVVRAFYGLQFPKPESGIVVVVYPLRFSTG